MDLGPYVEAVRQDLGAAAEAAGAEVEAAAHRLAFALEPSMRLALLDALGDATAEISAALPAGGVELRLRGREPRFVVLVPGTHESPVSPGPPEPGPATTPPGTGTAEGDDATARVSLRLPESLKAQAEEAAAREGVSLNNWLVRAATRALHPSTPPPPFARRLSGWAR